MIRKTLLIGLFLSLVSLPSLAASKEARNYAQYALDASTEWASQGDWVSRSNRMESYREAIFEKCFYTDKYSDDICKKAADNLLSIIGLRNKSKIKSEDKSSPHYYVSGKAPTQEDGYILGKVFAGIECSYIEKGEAKTKNDAVQLAFNFFASDRELKKMILDLGTELERDDGSNEFVNTFRMTREYVISKRCGTQHQRLPE